MSSVIFLSSSPPRIFAPSPTQAESPQALEPPVDRPTTQVFGRSSFKNVRADRDGFVPTFTTARQALGTLPGAENSPIGTPTRFRFKSSPPSCLNKGVEHRDTKSVVPMYWDTSKHEESVSNLVLHEIYEPRTDPDGHIHVQIRPGDARRKKKSTGTKKKEASNKGTTRKKDWTPPSVTRPVDNGEPSAEPVVFPTGLLRSFECAPDKQTSSATESKVSSVKRRKVECTQPKTVKSTSTKKIDTAQTMLPPPQSTVKKRSKSPSKKALTITGLATSNYFGIDEKDKTPLMQYLSSTQAKDSDIDSDNAVVQTKVLKKKTAISKKAQPKSKLVSPTTALKTFEDQEVIFASASQLVRDESPRLLRDMVEATKLSEDSLMSDPVPSQHTAPISVESTTPRLGISRFRGRRNLWGAGDRDEEKALLHMDDFSDTLVLRNAFVGKDALVEHGQGRSISPSKQIGIPNDSLHLLKNYSVTTFDIDDITTPNDLHKTARLPTIQRRTLHTDDRPDKSKLADAEPSKTSDPLEASKPSPQKEPPPPIPNFAGFPDDELKKQLTAYGFKRMRKRERMIDTLKKCWVEKYGAIEEETEPTSLRHSDFLSKVHDFSDRPKPKVKKARAQKRNTEGDKPKSTKKRKKAESASKETDGNGKAASEYEKRKATFPETDILDVSDIEDEIFSDKDSAVSEIVGDVPSFTGVGRYRAMSVTAAKKDKLPTPPSTVPVISISSSPPAFTQLSSAPPAQMMPTPDQSFDSVDRNEASVATENLSLPDLPDIKSQVERAIKHTSTKVDKSRNHKTNPTFHEKILMYDPIVLEDLTVWLNTEGLNAIGEDREVDIVQVKTWCEANGICCLWKGGWRGRGLKGKKESESAEG